MTGAAIYARVCSARQKKDQTIGSQTAALRAYAAEKRLELPEEWVFEDEGHSGPHWSGCATSSPRSAWTWCCAAHPTASPVSSPTRRC